MVQGSGALQASITVLAYVGGGLYPYAARHEVGGSTAPIIQGDKNVYYFSATIFTYLNPGTSPPPDGGSVRSTIGEQFP